jgi:UDP-glucose 4-epimerase
MEFHGRTLVTGAAGFMGSHLVELLARRGVHVRATARPGKDLSFFTGLGVQFVPADLTQPAGLPALFAGGVERVFHLGAVCNFSTPYRQLHPTNVHGVASITRLAMEAGVKRFVHASSTSVYGRFRGHPFREDDPREPCDDYGRSKRDGEDVIWQRVKQGLPAVVVRPCTVYGPRCRDGAGKAFSRPTSILAIPGSGKQILSNVHAEDVAAAMEHLSHVDNAVGQAYNIVDDSRPRLEEALRWAAEAFGTTPPRLHLPLPVVRAMAWLDGSLAARRGRIPDLEIDAVKYLYDDYLVDNTKLKATGFVLRHPNFKESMKRLGEDYARGRPRSE